jgi:hypothetical protein
LSELAKSQLLRTEEVGTAGGEVDADNVGEEAGWLPARIAVNGSTRPWTAGQGTAVVDR